MRVTRAVAAAANIHVDEHTDPIEIEKEILKELAPAQSPKVDDRAPLGELTTNSIESELDPDNNASASKKGKTRVRGGKQVRTRKLRQSEEQEVADDTIEDSDDDQEMETTEGDATQNSFIADPTVGISDDLQSLTVNGSPSMHHKNDNRAESPTTDESRILKPKSPAKQLLAKEKSGMRSTSNKENLGPSSPAAATRSPMTNYSSIGTIAETTSEPQTELSRTQTPRPASQHEAVTHDPIAAIDALEDAIEQVDSALPNVEEITSPQKSAKKSPTRATATATERPSKPSAASKSSSTRKSLASQAKSAPSADLEIVASTKQNRGRHSTVRPPGEALKDNPESAGAPAPKQSPVIPHSKPRPMSLSFPTPPKLQKSKPAALPTFVLPGEAVAAKLKAAKEARMKKEDDEVTKKPAFKARPAPKMKEGGAIVRQTNASRARQSLMANPMNEGTAASNDNGLKRATSVRTSILKSRPSIRVSAVANRLSTLPATTTDSSGPTPRARPIGTTSKPRPTSMIIDTKPRTSLANNQANTSKTRVASNPVTSSTDRPATKGTAKGKEVFRRAAVNQAELERQKKEKEDAAKKARAAAAERGRVLSREWAEKQKLKALKNKVEKQDGGVAV